MKTDKGFVNLHGSHDGELHRVNLDNVCYTTVIQERGRPYTQLIFNKETFLNVKETEKQIFGN